MNLGRRIFCSRTLYGLLVLLLVQCVSATGTRAQVRHTIIAASGEAAPAGGNYGNFLNTISLNARGQVAFDVLLGGPSTTGVFVSNGTTTSTIALGGDPKPGAANFVFVSAPSLTTSGDVIFNSGTGIFRGNGTTNVPLVQDGDPAPGGTSNSDLHLVARTGQSIAGKTLTRPLTLAQLDMDQHSIVWLGRFAGNAAVIVSSDLDSNFNE